MGSRTFWPTGHFCFHFFSRNTDIIYTGLPLYHSSAQWFAMGAAVHGGCTVILKKSFSASKFWPDVVKYKVTVGQYIGEIARFLLGKQSYICSTGLHITKKGQNLAKSCQK